MKNKIRAIIITMGMSAFMISACGANVSNSDRPVEGKVVESDNYVEANKNNGNKDEQTQESNENDENSNNEETSDNNSDTNVENNGTDSNRTDNETDNKDNSNKDDNSSNENGNSNDDNNNNNETESTEENEEDEKVQYVDNATIDLLQNDDYKNGDLETRKDMAMELLSQLESEGYIMNVYYDESNHIISYFFADGSLGGIQITDWDPIMN